MHGCGCVWHVDEMETKHPYQPECKANNLWLSDGPNQQRRREQHTHNVHVAQLCILYRESQQQYLIGSEIGPRGCIQ